MKTNVRDQIEKKDLGETNLRKYEYLREQKEVLVHTYMMKFK